MNGISKGKANLWNKIMNGKGLHFKILMLVLVLFTGLFFSQQMNVQADPAMTAEERQHYGELIKESDGIYYYLHIEGYLPTAWDSGFQDHFGFVLKDTNDPLPWSIDSTNNWLRIKVSNTSTDEEVSRLRYQYVIPFYDPDHADTEFDIINYNSNNTESSWHYTKLGRVINPVPFQGRYVFLWTNGYGYSSGLDFIKDGQKHDAIHFTSVSHSEYNGKSSFTPFTSVDLLSSTFDGSGTTEQKLNNNVSVYRVFRRDGEEKKVRVAPHVYGTTVGESAIERADWNDTAYRNQKIKYKMETSNGYCGCSNNFHEGYYFCDEVKNIETEYFTTVMPPIFNPYMCNCIAQKPGVNVLNLNDGNHNMTNERYFTDAYETSSVTKVHYDISTELPDSVGCEFNVKNRNDIDYMPLYDSAYDFFDSPGINYHTVNVSDGGVRFFFYYESPVTANVGISPFGRRIWVGSNNQSPRENATLGNQYALKQGSGSSWNAIGAVGDTKGAWYYDCYGTPQSDGSVSFSSVTFQMCGKRGRDFSSGWSVNNASNGMSNISGTSLKYATADNGNNIGGQGDASVKSENCVEFSVMPLVGEPKIIVTGENYTKYRVNFKCKDDKYKMSDCFYYSDSNLGRDDLNVDSVSGQIYYEWDIDSNKRTYYDVHLGYAGGQYSYYNDYYVDRDSVGCVCTPAASLSVEASFGRKYDTSFQCTFPSGFFDELNDTTVAVDGIIERPEIRVLNLNDNNRDMTDMNYFKNNYQIDGSIRLNENYDAFTTDDLKVRVKDGAEFASFAEGDAQVLSDNAGVKVSNGEAVITNYTGLDKVKLGIKPFKTRIWFGTETTGANPLWANRGLVTGYIIKRAPAPPSAGATSDDIVDSYGEFKQSFTKDGIVTSKDNADFEKGAWYYPFYASIENGAETNSGMTSPTDFWFEMIGRTGYEFELSNPQATGNYKAVKVKLDDHGDPVLDENGDPVYEFVVDGEGHPQYVHSCNVDRESISLGYAYKDLSEDILSEAELQTQSENGENCVQFKVSGVEKGEARVIISGHKYREYQNVFSSLDSPHKLTDLVKFNGIERDDGKGGYIQAWTVGSILNKDYIIKTKPGYIINGSDFRVDVHDNMHKSYKNLDGYFDTYEFSLSNMNKQNYFVEVGGIKAVREMKITSDRDVAITDDNQKELAKNGTSSEGTLSSYSLDDACFDLVKGSEDGKDVAAVQYKVKIRLKDSDAKREFIPDANAIASKIATKNKSRGNLLACEAKISNEDSGILELTLTLKNSGDDGLVTSYTIDVSDGNDPITKFRDCNVRFEIDMKDPTLAKSVYYNQIVNNIKIEYIGDDPSYTDEGDKDRSVSLRLIDGCLKSVKSNYVLYDKVKYKITLDPAVIDLEKLKASLKDSTSEINEIYTQYGADGQGVKYIIIGLKDDVEYKNNVTFLFNISDVIRSKEIDLCASSVLYEIAVEDDDIQKNKIVTAEYEEMYQDVPVAINGKNTFFIQYTDYSQTFDVSNIAVEDESGNAVPITSENAEEGTVTYQRGRATVTVEKAKKETNTVQVTVEDKESNSGSTEDIVKIICKAPASTSPPIRFTAIDGVKYYEVEKDDNGNVTGVDSTKPIQGTVNALTEEDFSFAVKCDDGYDINTLELKANKNTFAKTGDFRWNDDGGYRIFTISQEKVNSPYVISGRVDIKQLGITFDTRIGDFGNCKYIYNGSDTTDLSVLYGEGISFSVNLPDKCNQSNVTVKFKPENGDAVTLEKVNDQYLLNNIVSGGTISVDTGSLRTNEYPIAFTANDRAVYKQKDGQSLSGTRTVEHGGEYSFRVQPNKGYTLDDAVVLIKLSDGRREELKPDASGVYSTSTADFTKEGITQPCTISIENVEEVVYNIKLISSLGVTYLNGSDNVIKDSVQIKHGRNFEFAVSLDDAYDDSKDGMSIIVNDGKSSKSSAQKLASGRYVINNVEEDITIKVGNVSKNTYTVSLRGAEGIDYHDASGNIITGDNTVEHYSDFSFKVDLYPAYADSNITVMLGDTPMTPDGNGFYTISKITESKTVTVIGIEQSSESDLINKIGSLPDSLSDLGDVDDVIAATKQYEALPDDKKALVSNIDKLKDLQEQAKAFHHISNDVKIDGVDWYIKLYAIPITEDVDACGRIYKKLNNEYILSLYNVYLWNTLEDTRYYLPEGQSAVITLPTPDMTYFEKPTAIHEKDTGKVDFITLSISGDVSEFQTDSFSPMGIIATRSLTPGRSSLLDAADARLDAISQFAASAFGNDTKKVYNKSSSDLGGGDGNGSGSGSNNGDESSGGNIDEKFKGRNNRTTAMGSALRLILVLMIILLIASLIVFFMRRRKNKNKEE